MNDYIDPELIVNKNFFNEVKDIVICPICKGIINDSMQCNLCENNFCKKCINDYFKNFNTCPFNCQNAEIIKSSKIIHILISKLIFEKKNNEILSEIIEKPKPKIFYKCPECDNNNLEEKINEERDYQALEFEKKRIEIKELYDEKRRLIDELCLLKKIKNINEGGLIDKCMHFKANYKPIFKCCNQVYPCYICHDERETHTYIFSEKVLCLVCGNIYEGIQCNKCSTKQLYIKK